MYFSQNVIAYKEITPQPWELCQIVKRVRKVSGDENCMKCPFCRQGICQ
jgi:hypothetical protein